MGDETSTKPYYWLDAGECDDLIPAGEFIALGLAAVVQDDGPADVGNLDPTFLDILDSMTANVEVPLVGSFKGHDSCNGVKKRGGSESNGNERKYDDQERFGKRPRVDSHYTERPSRKRVRDHEEKDRRDRSSIRRKEQHFNGRRGYRDMDWREGKGYWERNRLGSKDMVFHPGS